MRQRKLTLLSVLILAGLVSACGKSREVQPNEYNDPQFKGSQSTLTGKDGALFSFGKGQDKAQGDSSTSGLAVNAYLWRAALDTLSFMPLSNADPFGGVIITDWYQPAAAQGERFKATAYILGRQLRADGVRVALFRQVQQGGQWVDAPVSASTSSELENKVLARARELRSQSGS